MSNSNVPWMREVQKRARPERLHEMPTIGRGGPYGTLREFKERLNDRIRERDLYIRRPKR